MEWDESQNKFKGLHTFMDEFNKKMQPFYEKIKIVEQNARIIFGEIAEKMKPVRAFYILAENQFTYWKPLCTDEVEEIISAIDVDEYLADKVSDKAYIDYNELGEKMLISDLLSETNKAILIQAIQAIGNGLYDLALVGIVTVFDGALSEATGDSSTKIPRRLNELKTKFEKLSDEEWENIEDSEMTLFGLYITWTETMKKFQEYSEFSNPETEPDTLNRHWIAHGRKTTFATRLDCCKMINALYGLLYLGDSLNQNNSDVL